MECVRAPASVEDASAIIAACTGYADWRPLFLMGLGTLMIFVAVSFLLIQALRSVIR